MSERCVNAPQKTNREIQETAYSISTFFCFNSILTDFN